MKKLLLAFMLMMSVSAFFTAELSAAPKQNAVEAYSDTTSTSANDTLAVDSQSRANPSINIDDFSYDPNRDGTLFDYLAAFLGTGGVIVLAILAVVFGLLFVFAPLIIIFLIIRYLYRRHQDRVKLMEMAMDKGINIPESERPIEKQSDEYLVKWIAKCVLRFRILRDVFDLGGEFLGRHRSFGLFLWSWTSCYRSTSKYQKVVESIGKRKTKQDVLPNANILFWVVSSGCYIYSMMNSSSEVAFSCFLGFGGFLRLPLSSKRP